MKEKAALQIPEICESSENSVEGTPKVSGNSGRMLLPGGDAGVDSAALSGREGRQKESAKG